MAQRPFIVTSSSSSTAAALSARQASDTEFLTGRQDSLLPGQVRTPMLDAPTPVVDWARGDSSIWATGNATAGTPGEPGSALGAPAASSPSSAAAAAAAAAVGSPGPGHGVALAPLSGGGGGNGADDGTADKTTPLLGYGRGDLWNAADAATAPPSSAGMGEPTSSSGFAVAAGGAPRHHHHHQHQDDDDDPTGLFATALDAATRRDMLQQHPRHAHHHHQHQHQLYQQQQQQRYQSAQQQAGYYGTGGGSGGYPQQQGSSPTAAHGGATFPYAAVSNQPFYQLGAGGGQPQLPYRGGGGGVPAVAGGAAALPQGFGYSGIGGGGGGGTGSRGSSAPPSMPGSSGAATNLPATGGGDAPLYERMRSSEDSGVFRTAAARTRSEQLSDELHFIANTFPPPPPPSSGVPLDSRRVRAELWFYHASRWDITHRLPPPPRSPLPGMEEEHRRKLQELTRVPYRGDRWLAQCAWWFDHVQRTFPFPPGNVAVLVDPATVLRECVTA